MKSYFPNLTAATRRVALAVAGFFVVFMRYRGLKGLVRRRRRAVRVAGAPLLRDRRPRQGGPGDGAASASGQDRAAGVSRDVTTVGQFLGFDIVLVSTLDEAVETVFASRQQRLTFFEAITRRAGPQDLSAF